MANHMILDNYIQSYGAELPKDWTYHQPGHQFEDECIMCNAKHDYIELFRYDPDNRNRRIGTGTHVCETCQQSIENSLLRMEYPEFAEGNKETLGPPDNAADIIDDNNRRSLNAFQRIADFNNNYEFDDSVGIRYTHLHYTREDYVEKGDSDKCYFCEEIIDEGDYYLPIRVPVTHNDRITGGIVKCCKKDRKLINDELLDVDLSAVEQYVSVQCFQCQTRYLIDSEETTFRMRHKRTAMRMCPSCAYEEVNKLSIKDNPFFILANAVMRRSPMFRFKECHCNLCLENISIDLTIAVSENVNSHIRNEKTVCEQCKILYPKYTEKVSYVYKHTPNVWALVYKEQDEWGYTIIKIQKNDRILEMMTTVEKYTIKSQPEAVSYASEVCYNLVEGKQLTLWADDD